MVPAGGGSFRTTKPSLHTTTNAGVIQRFLPALIRLEQDGELAWRIRVFELSQLSAHGLAIAKRPSPSITGKPPLRSPYCFSCGFAFGVLKRVSELIQFLVRHAKSRADFTPFGEHMLNPAQNLLRPGP